MATKRFDYIVIATAAAVFVLAAAAPSRADSVADFYKNKELRLLISSDVGGGYDLQSRLIGKYLEKYLPGHPNVVAQNMVGAGGRTEANYLYNVAPKDGSYIGMLMDTIVAVQAVGGVGVQFDAAKFNWIGSPEREATTVYAWRATGIKSINDVMQRETTIGASAKGSETYVVPQLANIILGTKFKIVTGYKGSATINMALERGDIQTSDAGNPSTLERFKPDWFRSNPPKIVYLLHSGPTYGEAAKTPGILDLVKDDADRKLARIVLAKNDIGRPIVAPPGVPADRVAALRAAFDAVMMDPEYIERAKASGFLLHPTSGAELKKIVDDVLATPKGVTARAKDIIAPNG